jgi:hypothetical protein
MPSRSGHVAPIRFVPDGSHEREAFGVWLRSEIGKTTDDGIRHGAVETLVLDGHEEADERRRRLSTIRVTQGLLEIADNSPCQFVQRISRPFRRVRDPTDAVGQLLQRDMKVCCARTAAPRPGPIQIEFACAQCRATIGPDTA